MVEYQYDSPDHIFPSTILTENLHMKRVSYDICSVQELYNLYSDLTKEETQYVTFSSYDSHIEAKEFMDQSIEEFENGESANYFIKQRNKDHNKPFIGTASFDPSWDQSIAESGIFLFKEFWGNGYSTERGEAMLDLAFNEMDFDYWISKCDARNKASAGAIENYVVSNGGKEVGVLPNWHKFAGGTDYTDILYFKLDRKSYLESRE